MTGKPTIHLRQRSRLIYTQIPGMIPEITYDSLNDNDAGHPGMTGAHLWRLMIARCRHGVTGTMLVTDGVPSSGTYTRITLMKFLPFGTTTVPSTRKA